MAFFSQYKASSFSRGEKVLAPNDEIDHLFFLTKGTVRMYSVSSEGEEVTLHLFRPGSIFPLMLSLSNTQNTYYFEAGEAVEVIKTPVEKTMAFLQSEPEILFDITKRFAYAICGLIVRIEHMTFEDAEKKVAYLLLYLVDRFGEKQGDGIKISQSLRHEDLGRWLGLTRETVSRQLSKLQVEGIVHVNQKHILISNMTLLKEKVK